MDVLAVKANAIISINVATANAGYLTTALNPAFAGLVSPVAANRTNAFNALMAAINPASASYLGSTEVNAVIGYLLANPIDLKDTLNSVFYAEGVLGLTGVDIALSGSVNIGTMTATAMLANNKQLTPVAGAVSGELGRIYISNFTATIPATSGTFGTAGFIPASWVTISAH